MSEFSQKPGVEYTDIDLNTAATTTVYDGTKAGVVHGVYMQNGGTSAVVQLEATDGTDTAVLTPGQGAGGGIAATDIGEFPPDNTLQVTVTTVEGAAQTNTLAVIRSE